MATFVKIEQGKVDKSIFDQYVQAHHTYVRDLIARGHQAKTGYWAVKGGGMMINDSRIDGGSRGNYCRRPFDKERLC